VPAVHAIEQAAFTDPWSVRDFRECVASEVVFLVAAAPDGVAGYVIAQDAADEGEILNLAVVPARHRAGIGRALVEHALAALGKRGAERVFLEVRESNAAARALYRVLGFQEVGRRSRYYRRPVEDAIVLRAAIPADGGHA
jgi:ribosomal-protein-alanine N-acetyltransferase